MDRFTLRLAVVRGIPIYLHWSFWLLLLWIAVETFLSPYFSLALLAARLILLGGLVASVILHELGHAFAAQAFGIQTRDITMYPFGGVASLVRLPEKPFHELLVALAGPAVNFLLIGLTYLGLVLLEAPLLLGKGELTRSLSELPSLPMFLRTFLVMNLVLGLFNLIPAFPMDGGRVLRALLATRLSYVRATQIAAYIGQGFAILFVILGLYGTPSLFLVGFFVFIAAWQERSQVEQRSSMEGFTVRDVLLREVPTLSVHYTLGDAIQALLASQAKAFLVVDPLGLPVGSLSREQIIEALGEGKPRATPLHEVMDRELISVVPTLPLQEGFRLLQETQKPFLLVVQNGRLLGIVEVENIAEFLLIARAERSGRQFKGSIG
ncbi:MAG: site-2 protease family protein [Bacteroidia bacterium]|nr:site-2 protease family protein [Bacteroidia bacterium]MDW8088697.1 site-2 protease family protein [Bacteroidia bacterium]